MKQAQQYYQDNGSKVYDTPIDQALRWLVPNADGKQLVALFDGRASRPVIANWRAGKRSAPQWAIDRINQRLKERQEKAAKIQPGPGRSTIGFRRWRANR
jgi:hypothetical protein